LDLYGLLSSMPKNTDVEHNPMDRDFPEFPPDFPELASTEASARSGDQAGTPQGKGKHTSKKILGRLKNKKLLEAQAQAAEKAVKGADEREREIKRARSEREHGTEDETTNINAVP